MSTQTVSTLQFQTQLYLYNMISITQCLGWKRKDSGMVLVKKVLSKFIILHSFIFRTNTLIT
jgi:hypothetical protein